MNVERPAGQDMLHGWIRSRPSDRVFLSSVDGVVTYGDLDTAPRGEEGQVTVEPDRTLRSVVELMTVPGRRRQLVLIDPSLPLDEKIRRREAAREAIGREALTVLFTSGTTGPAKAVRLTASNWAAAADAARSHLDLHPDDVWLAAMPLHHVGGVSILYRMARTGGSVRWLPFFDAAQAAEELRGGVTLASLVPTMLRRILDHDRRPFSGVRAVLVGGGPIPDGLVEEAHGRGLPVLPTYGLTETCAQVATLRPGSPPRHAAHPLPGVEIRIGPGERIEVRGAQVSPGYADEQGRPPGAWLTTRDRGKLENDGALVVLGRADHVIVTGGENVDPARVESVLLAHPDVESAAVVGVEDREWGMAVAAAYVGAVEPAALQAFVAPRLAPSERPKQLRRLDRIPTAGPGKPDRARIEELFRR